MAEGMKGPVGPDPKMQQQERLKMACQQVIKSFGQAELGNRLSPYAVDGLIFSMLRALDKIFEEAKREVT